MSTRESIDIDVDIESVGSDVELPLSDADILVDTPPPSAVVASLPPLPTPEGAAPVVGVSPPSVLTPPEAPRRALASTTMRPPAMPSALLPSSRLPPVSPPPFVRRPSMPAADEIADPCDKVETLPLPMKSPFETTAERRVLGASTGPAGGSVAPLTLSRDEETVIARRRRPRPRRSAWAVAAAGFVVVAAATVTHFVVRTEPSPAAASAPPSESTVLEATPVVAPVVVTFGEDEAVTIEAAASATPRAASKAFAASAEAPASSLGHPPPVAPSSRLRSSKASAPLSDGSRGVATKGPVSSPVAAPLAPASGRKRPLTPEQELAEAQLRAAAR